MADVTFWLSITGPIGAALLGAAKIIGPKAVDAWERARNRELDIEDRKAAALEGLNKGQGEVLQELRTMNGRLQAVEEVIVDKRFSDMKEQINQVLGLRQNTSPNGRAVSSADLEEARPADPPPPPPAAPAPAQVSITIAAAPPMNPGAMVAAAQPSGPPLLPPLAPARG